MQTILITGWMLSVVFLIATAVVVVRLNRERNKTDAPVQPWLAATAGLFVAIVCILGSQALAGIGVSGDAAFPLGTLFATLQMFLMNRDIGLEPTDLSALGGAAIPYLYYNAALHLAAPIETLGTVVALVGQLLVVPRMKFLAIGRDVYVFSTLNSESLALAKSTQEHYRRRGGKCLIVFGNTDKDAVLASDAKDLDMMRLPQSPDYIAKSLRGNESRHSFVFSDAEDEAANISAGVELAHRLARDDYASAEVPRVVIFSDSAVGGPVVDAVASQINDATSDKPSIKVDLKRIDRIRRSVYALIDRYPLFTTGLLPESLSAGSSEMGLAFDPDFATRRVLIVGDGALAREFLKAALWASQMGEDVAVSIDVVTADSEHVREQLGFEAPELTACDGRPYQGFYRLKIEEVNPESGAYLEYLRESGKYPNYVLVAMDDDLACATVARRTRELLEQRRLASDEAHAPAFIAAAIRDTELAESLLHMTAKKRPYGIVPVGSVSDVYSYANVFSRTLDFAARNLNRVYSCNEVAEAGKVLERKLQKADLEFANSEYDQRSSTACALHRKCSLFLFCRREHPELLADIDWMQPLRLQDAGDSPHSRALSAAVDAYEEYFESGKAKWLSEVEHDRWSAYMSAEGFECMRARDVGKVFDVEGKHNSLLGRLHPCLIRFADLPDLDRVVLQHDKTSKPFQTVDDIVLNNTRLIATADEAAFLREWARSFKSDAPSE